MTAQENPIRTLVDGEFTAYLPLTDRSWQYGDGCFTTIAVQDGELVDWERHWQRLVSCQQKLGLGTVSAKTLFNDWKQLQQQCATHELSEAVLKIVLTRGDGGRGYQEPDSPVTRRVLMLSAFPKHYSRMREQGIIVGTAQLQLAQQPALAGLKTLNRLEQVLLKRELRQHTEVDDLVVTDTAGHVIETTVANLFWRQGRTWYTPDLSAAGIAGVAREQILANNPHIQIGHYPLSELSRADEMVVTNSLLGLVPVRRYNGRELPGYQSYPQQLNTVLEAT